MLKTKRLHEKDQEEWRLVGSWTHQSPRPETPTLWRCFEATSYQKQQNGGSGRAVRCSNWRMRWQAFTNFSDTSKEQTKNIGKFVEIKGGKKDGDEENCMKGVPQILVLRLLRVFRERC